jgi:hypothetical protein
MYRFQTSHPSKKKKLINKKMNMMSNQYNDFDGKNEYSRNNSQPNHWNTNKNSLARNEFSSMDKPSFKMKNSDNRPVKGMNPEDILMNYYPLSSINKKKKQYNVNDLNDFESKKRFQKLKNKWMSPKSSNEQFNKKKFRKGSRKQQTPVQIIQQINIKNIKKQTINIMSNPKIKSQWNKSKMNSKKHGSAYTERYSKPRTLSKKSNTNDLYKAHRNKQNKSTNLKYNSSRLKAAQRKLARSGITHQSKKSVNPRHEELRKYKMKHLRNTSANDKIKQKEKLRKSKMMTRNYGRTKAATTSIHKKSYKNTYLTKNSYVKKKATIKKKQLIGNYKDKNRVIKKSDSNAYGKLKKRTQRIYGYMANKGKTPPQSNKGVTKKKITQSDGSKMSKSKTKRNLSLYQSKYGRKKKSVKKGGKAGKTTPKRYVFKSQRTKEKQMKRELRLKEEMKKLNEKKKKKFEEEKIVTMGFTMLEKKAKKSVGTKELLDLVNKGKNKEKYGRRVQRNYNVSTTPLNKLKHFRDSLKKTKQNNTLSSNEFEKQSKMFSDLRDSRERMKKQLKKNTGRVLSFGHSKKLNERRSRKFKEKNKIKSLNHQRADKELKIALEHIEGTLEGIDSIRRSGLREKTTRSLSKRLKKFMKRNQLQNPENFKDQEEIQIQKEETRTEKEKIKISEIKPNTEEPVVKEKESDLKKEEISKEKDMECIHEGNIPQIAKEDTSDKEFNEEKIEKIEKEVSIRVKEKRSSLSDESGNSKKVGTLESIKSSKIF